MILKKKGEQCLSSFGDGQRRNSRKGRGGSPSMKGVLGVLWINMYKLCTNNSDNLRDLLFYEYHQFKESTNAF